MMMLLRLRLLMMMLLRRLLLLMMMMMRRWPHCGSPPPPPPSPASVPPRVHPRRIRGRTQARSRGNRLRNMAPRSPSRHGGCAEMAPTSRQRGGAEVAISSERTSKRRAGRRRARRGRPAEVVGAARAVHRLRQPLEAAQRPRSAAGERERHLLQLIVTAVVAVAAEYGARRGWGGGGGRGGGHGVVDAAERLGKGGLAGAGRTWPNQRIRISCSDSRKKVETADR